LRQKKQSQINWIGPRKSWRDSLPALILLIYVLQVYFWKEGVALTIAVYLLGTAITDSAQLLKKRQATLLQLLFLLVVSTLAFYLHVEWKDSGDVTVFTHPLTLAAALVVGLLDPYLAPRPSATSEDKDR